LQAEPVDTHIPFSSNLNNNASPLISLNEKFEFPGSLFILSPFNFTPFIFASICDI